MSTSMPPPHDPLAQGGPLDPQTARALLARADELLGAGDYASARPLYRRLVGHREPELHVAALLGTAEASYRLDEEPVASEAWRLATQAPETPLSWYAWKQLAAAAVRAGDLEAAKRAYREAARRAPGDEHPEIASRLGWLNKETGDERAATRYFGRARAGRASPPVVTYTIIAFTVAIWVSNLLGGGDIWYQLFALDKSAVARGELWRLVTVVLVHDPRLIFHVATNMYALYLAGPIVEGLYGRPLFVLFYVLCAAAGSVASYVFVPNDAVGASGAIFGLFGLLLVVTRVHRPPLAVRARALTSQIGLLIGLNLLLGFGLAGTGFPLDNAAHVGGLLCGAWLGFSFVPRGVVRSPAGAGGASGSPLPPTFTRTAAVLVVVVVIAAGLALGGERRNGRRAAGDGDRGVATAWLAVYDSGQGVTALSRSGRPANRSSSR